MKAQGFTHDDKNNVTHDWWTPKYIFDALGLTFDMDVAGPKGGVPWLPAKRTLTIDDDGLFVPWEGAVWCNPPYGKETGKWLERLHNHNNGIALVFARTDCRWFHDYCAKADAILFLQGRIAFVDATNVTGGGGAGAGSMLVAWGAVAKAALNNCKLKGLMVNL